MSHSTRIDELLTIADVAGLLVYSEANVYALIDAGQLH